MKSTCSLGFVCIPVYYIQVDTTPTRDIDPGSYIFEAVQFMPVQDLDKVRSCSCLLLILHEVIFSCDEVNISLNELSNYIILLAEYSTINLQC